MAKIAGCGGHGIGTAGKRTPPMPGTGRVIKEWEFNHPTSRYLKEELERAGHQFLHTSDTTVDTSISVRANKANHFNADVYASVHYNAENHLFDKYVDGVETLYRPGSVKGKKLAEFIQAELVKATGFRDRGIKPRMDLGILNLTKMPAVIVECGFMDNQKEAAMMLDVTHQKNCAEAIARGILKYLDSEGKGIVPPKSTVVPGGANIIKVNLMGKSISVKGLYKDNVNYVYVNNKLVPIRQWAAALGLKVGWDPKTSTVSIDV